nr:protein ALWAYS EARLY 2-like isoform X1 [Tanacetum cinerariifolium]
MYASVASISLTLLMQFSWTHYTELRSGSRDGLPTYLAKPILVGQRVIAIYKKTREIHDGTVLTVDHDRFRVQFNLPKLGAEIIMVRLTGRPQFLQAYMPITGAHAGMRKDLFWNILTWETVIRFVYIVRLSSDYLDCGSDSDAEDGSHDDMVVDKGEQDFTNPTNQGKFGLEDDH